MAMESELMINPQAVKKNLAEELTIRIHSSQAYESAMQVSELLFNPKANQDFLNKMSHEQFEVIALEIPSFKLPKEKILNVSVIDLLSESTTICSSKSEARKAIQNQAISISKIKVSQLEQIILTENLVHDRWLMIENGKKNKYLIEVICFIQVSVW